MSYILEALKKVEQERAIGQVPGIASGHEQAHRTGFNRWLWVVIGVLALNALLLVVVLWPRPDIRTDHRPVGYLSDAITPEIPDSSVPTPQPGAPATNAVKPVLPAKTVMTGKNKPPAALRPLPALPEPAPAADVKAPLTGFSVPDITAKSRTAGPVPPNNNLPVWPQVSSQLFQQINSGLHLDVHVYSELPQDRFVLINMQKYHEGEQLQEGPLVDEITLNDVILSYRGQRFRVQSQ